MEQNPLTNPANQEIVNRFKDSFVQEKLQCNEVLRVGGKYESYYDYLVSSVPYPDKDKINNDRWKEFQNTPLPAGVTPAQIKDLEKLFHENVKIEIQNLRNAYQDNVNNVTNIFWQDVEKEFKFKLEIIMSKLGDPLVKNRIANYAWENGHANGLSEVYIIYKDLIEVIRG